MFNRRKSLFTLVLPFNSTARSQTWHNQMRYTGPHIHGCAHATDAMTGMHTDPDGYLQARMTHSLPPGLHDRHVYPGFAQRDRRQYSSSSEESFSPRQLDGPTLHRSISPAHRRKSSRKHSKGRKNSLRHQYKTDRAEMESDPEDSNLYCEPEFQYSPHPGAAVQHAEHF